MREQLRDGDVLARLGGDEFGVLASTSRRGRRAPGAERLRAAHRRLYLRLGPARSYIVTASIGGALMEPASAP